MGLWVEYGVLVWVFFEWGFSLVRVMCVCMMWCGSGSCEVGWWDESESKGEYTLQL